MVGVLVTPISLRTEFLLFLVKMYYTLVLCALEPNYIRMLGPQNLPLTLKTQSVGNTCKSISVLWSKSQAAKRIKTMKPSLLTCEAWVKKRPTASMT